MLPAARVALAVALLASAAAGAQDYRVVAELGRAGGERVEAVSVLSLSAGGPPFVVSVGRSFVNAWRAGRVAEPVVSPLADVWVGGAAPAFGDFDGDGRIDLAVTASTGVAILRGDGAGGFAPAASIASGASAIAVADFDGDGRADLVIGSNSSFTCYLSSGGFSFAGPKTTAVTTSGGVLAMTPGDVDGDGRIDFVVQPSGRSGPVSVWRGGGDGTFALYQQQLFGDYSVGRVNLADLDGDGLPEVVYANPSHMGYMVPVEIYKNDGGGKFHVWAEPQMTRSASQPLVADIDGDGHPDVAFFDEDPASGPHLAWYRASGGVLVESRKSVPAGSDVLAAADWDGDRRAEIFLRAKLGIPVLALQGSRADVSVVPILLSTTGLYGSRFDSDLLLTNSGSTSAHLALRYTAAAGGGSGVVERDLAAGRQVYAVSAVGFLRDAGLPIAVEGNVIGTLRVEVTGASSPRAVSASVRTTTPKGAGVAWNAFPSVTLLREASILPWLIESARDRTNLALVNAGSDVDGPVTLRVTVFPGSPGSEPPAALPDVTLQPGEFFQYGRVLAVAGLAAPVGWARVTRVAGNAPYLAWAAVNDAGSGDGSFEAAAAGTTSSHAVYPFTWIVPNAVQTSRYGSEFASTNPGTEPVTLKVTLVATGTILTETIAPGATFYLPDLFAELRRRGLAGAPAAGVDTLSPLYIERDGVFGGPVFAGIRVSSSPSPGVSYGVFEAATPIDAAWGISAVVPDLRQGAGVRTNLGIVNLYGSALTFRVEIVDGETGAVAATTSVDLAMNEVRQMNAVLPALAPGTKRAYARVTPVPFLPYWPTNFFAYAVVNDGSMPGAGTDDGSFAPAIPE